MHLYFFYFLLNNVFFIHFKNEQHNSLLVKLFSRLGYLNSVLDVFIYVLIFKEL
jgi:hypothetical protein